MSTVKPVALKMSRCIKPGALKMPSVKPGTLKMSTVIPGALKMSRCAKHVNCQIRGTKDEGQTSSSEDVN